MYITLVETGNEDYQKPPQWQILTPCNESGESDLSEFFCNLGANLQGDLNGMLALLETVQEI